MRHSRSLFDRRRNDTPAVSVVLLDWCVRESFHTLDYLARQTVPRNQFEILWIEYYDKVAQPIADRIAQAEASGAPPPVDRWLVMDMPRSAYYHKHLMYNVGLLASRGRVIVICDSDAMVKPTFVESIIRVFEDDPSVALHLDEVRNVSRAYYPFNGPPFEALEGEGAINWQDGKTTGILATRDRVHRLNYGACFCGRRADLFQIGGADESVDFLGHVCGPYELTWRLVNLGRRETWHETEFLYHTWHPGTDGEENYFGPHDGRNVSTTALEARRSGRTMPLVENPAVRLARQGAALPSDVSALIDLAVGGRDTGAWVIDDVKRWISAGRVALSRGNHAEALRCWEVVAPIALSSSSSASDLGWARYFLGKYDEARAAFDASLALDISNPSALRGLAWTARQQQRYDDAIRDFTRALMIDPHDLPGEQEARRGRAWAWMLRGSFAEALEDFDIVLRDAAVDDIETLQDAHRGRGWCLLRVGRSVEAEAEFEAALHHLRPDAGLARDDALKGREVARTARIESSTPHASRLTGAGPSRQTFVAPTRIMTPEVCGRSAADVRAALRASLGWAHLDHHNYADAALMFDDALLLNPDNLDARCGRAWIGFAEQPSASRAALDGLIEAATAAGNTIALGRAFRARGWMRIAASEFDDAIADFSSALAHISGAERESRSDTLEGRAYAYYQTGRRAEARLDAALGRGRISALPGRFALDMFRLRRRLRHRATRSVDTRTSAARQCAP